MFAVALAKSLETVWHEMVDEAWALRNDGNLKIDFFSKKYDVAMCIL